MSDRKPPPHNLDAEASLIGAMMMSVSACEIGTELVTGSDFYKPSHGVIFTAIAMLRHNGEVVDAVTVCEELRQRNELEQVGGAAELISLQAHVPAINNAEGYARIVSDLSQRRMLAAAARALYEEAMEGSAETGDLLDSATSRIREIDSAGLNADPEGLTRMTDFLDRPEEMHAPWAIEGLVRTSWRVIIVGTEGLGKTVVLRQIGMCAAQGLHPFTHQPIEPMNALIVDLENPDESIDEVCGPIMEAARRVSNEFDPDRLWLWHRPAGIDLRVRRDRSTFEEVIKRCRPKIVCIGPAYKMFRATGKDSDEVAVGDVQHILDDLRTRYGFGLLMEHHVPKKQGTAKRELNPHGSALWMRWPELGLGMDPIEGDVRNVRLTRFRGDRVKNMWPERLQHGNPWPWQGVWPTGTFAGTVPLLKPLTVVEEEEVLDF